MSFDVDMITACIIEFPPEENQPIRYEVSWFNEEAKIVNISFDGFSYNLLEVLQILIGELFTK